MKTKRAQAISTLMGSEFLERARLGNVIDRLDQKKRGARKNLKHLALPDTLARFFEPVGVR